MASMTPALDIRFAAMGVTAVKEVSIKDFSCEPLSCGPKEHLKSLGYQILHESSLGEGAFATVTKLLVSNTSGRTSEFAYRISKFSAEQIARSMGILKRCGTCPEIMGCYSYFIESGVTHSLHSAARCSLSQAFCEKSFYSFFSFTDQKKWGLQLLAAVDFLHDRHIVHRDIKSDNLFLYPNKKIQLGDFDFALELPDENPCVVPWKGGTHFYMSPELYQYYKESMTHPIDLYAADAWAMGLVLAEIGALERINFRFCESDFGRSPNFLYFNSDERIQECVKESFKSIKGGQRFWSSYQAVIFNTLSLEPEKRATSKRSLELYKSIL